MRAEPHLELHHPGPVNVMPVLHLLGALPQEDGIHRLIRLPHRDQDLQVGRGEMDQVDGGHPPQAGAESRAPQHLRVRPGGDQGRMHRLDLRLVNMRDVGIVGKNTSQASVIMGESVLPAGCATVKEDTTQNPSV